MNKVSKYSAEVPGQAVRMVEEHTDEHVVCPKS